METHAPPHPYHRHSSTPLTHALAHAQLATYLSLAEVSAAYRPDSTLTERGPVSSSGPGNPSLVLMNLRRVLRGMEGQRIGGDTSGIFGTTRKRAVKGLGDDGDNTDRLRGSGRRKFQTASGGGGSGGTEFDGEDSSQGGQEADDEQEGEEGEEGDWQDRGTYDLEQDDSGVETPGAGRSVGPHANGSAEGDDEESIVGVEAEGGEEAVDAEGFARSRREREHGKEAAAAAARDVKQEKKKKGKDKEAKRTAAVMDGDNLAPIDKEERKRRKKERQKKTKKTARSS